ncbi:MAG TPA: TonB family protein [Thermoanaerobaculia bacterium]
MARRFTLAALLILLGAGQVAACSMKGLDPSDLVENTPVYSANGRFCVVVRWQEGLADFTSQLAGTFFHMDDQSPRDAPPRKTVIAALYESGTKSRRLIAEIPLDIEKTGDVLVPDSGRYLVVRGPSHGCDPGAREGDTLVTIYDAEGARVGALKVEDVFTPSDVLQLSRGHVPVCQLRHESQDQEVVVLSVYVPQQEGNEPRYEERRIDVATAALLDPRRDIYPVPRSYATPATDRQYAGRAYDPQSPDCAAAYADLVRVDPRRFFAQVVLGPAPEFPPVALKARIRGVVSVEVVVSESGDVLCTRNTRLPFGLDQAAVEAARRWKFRPFIVNGHPAKAAGEILFHFQDVDEETWQELLRDAPSSVR